MHTWVIYLIGLALFFALFSFVEKAKVFRGVNRGTLNPVVEKSLRAVFLIVFCGGPLIYLNPWIFGPLLIVYLPTYLDGAERTGARRDTAVGRWVRGWWIWKFITKYFDTQLYCTTKLDSKKQYILAVHPHGILPFATMVALISPLLGAAEKLGCRFYTLAASFCYVIPLYRDMVLGGGAVDAGRAHAVNFLRDGHSIALFPGGATEALYSRPGFHCAYIRKRTGFVKLALESGADLVPVYSFGESDVYDTLQLTRDAGVLTRTILWLRGRVQAVIGISVPILMHIKPHPAKIRVVTGEPLAMPRIDNPTPEDVKTHLDRYIEALVALFDAHASKYVSDPTARKLHIV